MLTFEITDLIGIVYATVDKHYGGNVVIPVSDSRTAEVVVDFWSPVCAEVRSLSRMLKVRYDDILLFWGQITVPDWGESQEDRLTITAHDATFRMKHRNLGIDDPPCATGYTIDGPGLWSLVQATEPTVEQATTYGVPGTGIVLGTDTSHHKSTLFKAERGVVIFDEFANATAVAGAPDWNLRPVDAFFPGIVTTWVPGITGELSFFSKQGDDLKEALAFHYGWGRNNCKVSWVPDGTQVVNYEVRTAQGGPTDTDLSDSRALKNDTDSWGEYGIMERWTATNHPTDDTTDMAALRKIMGAEAQATVDAYKEPPNYFTVTLNPQGAIAPGSSAEEPYKPFVDFHPGDEIRIVARRGHFKRTIDGRVMNVTLTDDEKGNTTTSMNCVPNVNVDAGGFDES